MDFEFKKKKSSYPKLLFLLPYQIRQWDLLTSSSKYLDDDASTDYRRIIYAKINLRQIH